MRISDFKAVVNSYGGFARTNLFVVELIPSGQMVAADTRDLTFFCKAALLPGINLTLAEHKPYAIGLPQSSPVGMTSETINCIFMLDDKHQVLKFFHQWLQSVMNYHTSDGITRTGPGGLAPYEIGYLSEYAMEMSIRVYSAHDPSTYYECQLHKVFPTQVSGVNLSWEDGAQIATITVNFAYSAIKMQGTRTAHEAAELSPGLRGVDFYRSVASTVVPVERFDNLNRTIDVINALTASNGNMLRFFS